MFNIVIYYKRLSSPLHSITYELNNILILSLFLTLSSIILLALNWSLLNTIVTYVLTLDKCNASSQATSPPPTTKLSLFLAIILSHYAHALIPCYQYFFSPGISKRIASDPVAIINAYANKVSFFAPYVILNGLYERST